MVMEQIQIIFEKGGVMMIPLGICSFLVVLITIERLLFLRKGKLVSSVFYEQWRKWFSSNMSLDHKPKVLRRSVLSGIFHPISTFFPLGGNRLEERISDLSRKEKHKLEQGLVFLDTIAGIAPLFGLLGTALGMVDVFSRLSMAGEAKMEALSSGISQALFTTVAGLFIGIPALIAYNLFTRHVDNILVRAEDQVNALVDEFGDLMTSEPADEVEK